MTQFITEDDVFIGYVDAKSGDAEEINPFLEEDIPYTATVVAFHAELRPAIKVIFDDAAELEEESDD